MSRTLKKPRFEDLGEPDPPQTSQPTTQTTTNNAGATNMTNETTINYTGRKVTIEGANIPRFMRNFKGAQDRFNAKGDRNFCVFLEPELALAMQGDGWNVKFLKPREEEDEPQAYIQVKAKMDGQNPPRVVMVTGRGQNPLDEETIAELDSAPINNFDLIFTAYDWNVNGNTGRTAYLQTLYATLEEDDLMQKYADIRTYTQGGSED